MRPEKSGSWTTDRATGLMLSPSLGREARARVDLLHQFLSCWRSALAALIVVTILAYLAGRSRASLPLATAWFAVAFINTCAQAAVCMAMERCAESPAALMRWHKWLVASVGLNGIVWGCSTLLVMEAGLEEVWYAALLDMMLVFCVASAPGTRQMICAPVLPIAIVAPVALLGSGANPVWALGYGGLVLLVAFYGLRLHSVRVQGLIQRFAAQDLAAELEDKQAKLAQQQAQLIAMERERTLLLERQRLMRDMHDGLGASLMASLSAARRGIADSDQIATLLSDCVDDLRSVIDSLEPCDNNLATLLGSMRSRLDRRIQSAGMQLEWRIDDLPPLPWMGPTEALHVMRIVQEAVTNSVKHSQAQRVRIVAQAREASVEVCISDDGRGFDVHADSAGRGLKFSGERARGMRAIFEVRSVPARGCSAKLALPLTT